MSFPILIVEDSEEDSLWLKRQLDHAGLCNPCHIVKTAEEAMDYIEGRPPYSDRAQFPLPKVLLLDIKLPGIDGFEFLHWLKENPKSNGALIVTISGLGELAAIRRAYELGANSFLNKPCNPIDLENLIQGFPGYWERRTPV